MSKEAGWGVSFLCCPSPTSRFSNRHRKWPHQALHDHAWGGHGWGHKRGHGVGQLLGGGISIFQKQGHTSEVHRGPGRGQSSGPNNNRGKDTQAPPDVVAGPSSPTRAGSLASASPQHPIHLPLWGYWDASPSALCHPCSWRCPPPSLLSSLHPSPEAPGPSSVRYLLKQLCGPGRLLPAVCLSLRAEEASGSQLPPSAPPAATHAHPAVCCPPVPPATARGQVLLPVSLGTCW